MKYDGKNERVDKKAYIYMLLKLLFIYVYSILNLVYIHIYQHAV